MLVNGPHLGCIFFGVPLQVYNAIYSKKILLLTEEVPIRCKPPGFRILLKAGRLFPDSLFHVKHYKATLERVGGQRMFHVKQCVARRFTVLYARPRGDLHRAQRSGVKVHKENTCAFGQIMI